MDQNAFKEYLKTTVASGFTCMGVCLGHRLKLFDTLGGQDGPKTAEQLAAAAECRPEYITAWLNMMVAGRIVEVSEADGSLVYFLPKDRLPYVTATRENYVGMAGMIPIFANMFSGVVDSSQIKNDPTFEADLSPIWELFDELRRGRYQEAYIRYTIGQVPGLQEKLEQGIRVCELGCGKGLYCRALGQMFPRTTVIGSDISEDSVQKAQSEISAAGVNNVTLSVADAQQLPKDWTETFDYVIAIDVMHHASDITQMMVEIYRILKPGGSFSVFDSNMHSNVKDNVGKPVASMLYPINLFLRVPSLFRQSTGEGQGHGHSHGHHQEGQGITMGIEKIIAPLLQAGFKVSEPQEVEQTQDCHIIATKM